MILGDLPRSKVQRGWSVGACVTHLLLVGVGVGLLSVGVEVVRSRPYNNPVGTLVAGALTVLWSYVLLFATGSRFMSSIRGIASQGEESKAPPCRKERDKDGALACRKIGNS